MPLRQYRVCVVDSLGLGITCVLYYSSMCTRHPNVVSSAFYAIPIFHIIIFYLLVVLTSTHVCKVQKNIVIAGPHIKNNRNFYP